MSTTNVASMPTKKPVGICPACGEAVYNSRETDGPVWTCPSDLARGNVYWQPASVRFSKAERTRYFANCPDLANAIGIHKAPCPYEHMPLHAACYEHGNY